MDDLTREIMAVFVDANGKHIGYYNGPLRNLYVPSGCTWEEVSEIPPPPRPPIPDYTAS